MRIKEYLVRFGRTDQTVIKTNFLESKRSAMQISNNVAFLLWGVHPFKSSECNQSVRVEREGFWIEFHPSQGGAE